MSWLNIVERELRVGARRKGLYRTRYASACAAVVIVIWFLVIPNFNSPREFSQALFMTLSVAAYFSAGLAGFSVTSDCLSEERREGTLGLLFLTELRGVDIVAGKLAATSLHVIYGLVAFVPVLAIAILAGGVSGTEFTHVVLAAFNLLFLSLSLGMFTSVLYREGTHSLSAAFVLFSILLAGIPMGAGILKEYNWISSETAEQLLILCPGTACVLGFPGVPGSATEMRLFHSSLLCVHLMSWALLLFAVLQVGRSWQDLPVAPRERGWRRWWSGTRDSRLSFRSRWLDLNPYAWRCSRQWRKPILVWVVLGTGWILYAWGAWRYPENYRDPATMIFVGFLSHTILKLWVAIEAPHAISEDKRNGALELLLVTPLSGREIVEGQRAALYRQFLKPTLVVLAIDLAFLARCLAWPQFGSDRWTVALLIAGMITLVADLPTLARHCMAQAVRAKGENRAVISSLLLILGGPWVLQFIFFAVLAGLWSSRGWGPFPGADILPVIVWVIFSLLVNAFAWWSASRTLPDGLREAAASRFDRHTSPES